MSEIINIQSGVTYIPNDIYNIFMEKLVGEKTINEDKSTSITLTYSIAIKINSKIVGMSAFHICIITLKDKYCEVLFHNYRGWCGTGCTSIVFKFKNGKINMKEGHNGKFKPIDELIITDDNEMNITLSEKKLEN